MHTHSIITTLFNNQLSVTYKIPQDRKEKPFRKGRWAAVNHTLQMEFGKHKIRAHSHDLRHTSSMIKVDGSPVLIMLRPSSIISQEKACHLQHPNCARTCKPNSD